MSNNSNNLLAATEDGRPLVKIGSAAGIAAIAPQLLGFRPRESLVLTFFDANRQISLTSRVDLPIDPGTEHDAVGDLLDVARHSGWWAIHIAIVTATPGPHQRLAPELSKLAQRHGLTVLGCGIVQGAIWRSVDDDGQLDAGGESLAAGDALAATSQLVLAGRSFVPDRDVLVQQVRAAGSASDEVAQVLSHSDGPWLGISQPGRTARALRRAIEEAIVDYLTGKDDRPEPKAAALWIAGMSDARIREAVLWRLSPAAPSHVQGTDSASTLEALAWLLRLAPDQWSAPLSASLAALAWQGGQGVLAGIAAQYALECDPTNKLGQLVNLALDRAAPPTVWIDLMRSMTVQELRNSRRGSRVGLTQGSTRQIEGEVSPQQAFRAAG